jgi:hypothetical protein
MPKLTNEDNDASLLAMENRLFDHLFDATKDQSQAMYAFVDHISPHSNEPTIQEAPDDNEISSTPYYSNEPTIQESHHLSNSCDNAQPLHNIGTDSSSTPPRLNKPTIQETPDGNEISSISPNSNRPTIQENPDGDEISITSPSFNALPIQETPDGDEIATSSERNISP